MKSCSLPLLASAAITLLIVGCAHETVIKDTSTPVSNEHRPAWTLTPSPPANGKTYFTGRSLAVNVLDEKHGIDEAMNDAIYQIARAAGADVKGRVTIVDRRSGEAVRGKEKTDQPSDSRIDVQVNGTVIGIRQEDTFWERYSMREKIFGEKVRRYKYYVLVSVPEDELKRLQGEVKKKSQRN
jgi:hypothetical protein